MKLLFCNNCENVFKLTRKEKTCGCGKCGGVYLDKLNAEYWGDATPLGFNNFELNVALMTQPKKGMGADFGAFVIPEECTTFKKVK